MGSRGALGQARASSRMRRVSPYSLAAAALLVLARPAGAQQALVLRPAAVFDGAELHAGWAVRVEGARIAAVGASVPTAGARILDFPDATLIPGLIEGHSHL